MPDEQDSKQLSQQRYTQFAEGYVASQSHAQGYDLERLVALSQAVPDMRMLDIATGGGHTALAFAALVNEVVASDLTPAMLIKAEEHIRAQGVSNVRFEVADAEHLPFQNSEFDLATCRIAPHHFPDVPGFLSETVRVLKPGGLFLMQDHVLPADPEAASIVDAFEHLRDPSHNRAYSRSIWLAMFDRAGFSVEHVEEVVKRHNFIAWSERQGNPPETQQALLDMLQTASESVRVWMAPEHWGTPDASFANHHILIAGRKPNVK
jgi:ubiquinone/menaquinone biosynthesis C-methylase UbiE